MHGHLVYMEYCIGCSVPHVVILLEERVVLHGPLLELQVYTAAIDADNAPDPADREREGEEAEKERDGGVAGRMSYFSCSLHQLNSKLSVTLTRVQRIKPNTEKEDSGFVAV